MFEKYGLKPRASPVAQSRNAIETTRSEIATRAFNDLNDLNAPVTRFLNIELQAAFKNHGLGPYGPPVEVYEHRVSKGMASGAASGGF